MQTPGTGFCDILEIAMIPREFRMKHKKDFDVLFAEGRFVRGEFLSASVWKIDTEKYPRRAYTPETLRVSFIVSKKIDKKAVGRNKLKRLMREAVRLDMKAHAWQPGYLVAFMATPKTLEATLEDLSRDVEQITKKASLV